MAFATVHTFLLVNGFDLAVTSKAGFEFIMKTIAEGKFRFALLREWSWRILCRLIPRLQLASNHAGGVIPKDGAVQPAEGSPSATALVKPEIPRSA